MAIDDELIGCPVCDRMIDPEAAICPGCGTDFTIYGMEELMEVVNELNRPAPVVEPEMVNVIPPVTPLQPAEDSGPRKSVFSRLFGRR